MTFIHLYKSVVRICKTSNRVSFYIPDVLEDQRSRILPKDVKFVHEEAVLDHFRFVIPKQELLDLVGVSHAYRL